MPERSKLIRYAESLHAPNEIGITRIQDVTDRQIITVLGTIHSLTLRPRSGVPALEAEIEDGTGRVVCVWLGRRAIRGISAGRDIIVSGRVTRHGQQWRIYNPTYVLRPNA
jgi:RecG-like helicase